MNIQLGEQLVPKNKKHLSNPVPPRNRRTRQKCTRTCVLWYATLRCDQCHSATPSRTHRSANNKNNKLDAMRTFWDRIYLWGWGFSPGCVCRVRIRHSIREQTLSCSGEKSEMMWLEEKEGWNRQDHKIKNIKNVCGVLQTVEKTKGERRIGLSTQFQHHGGPKPFCRSIRSDYVALRQFVVSWIVFRKRNWYLLPVHSATYCL